MGASMKAVVTVLLLLRRFPVGNGSNLSPTPNYTFKQPSLHTFMSQTRSSYFGYSVTLRQSGVLVGAPRAQSDVEYQRHVNETGAVYRCSFAPTRSQCHPLLLDKEGNTSYEDYYNEHPEIRSERKDHQMLGATGDGLGADGTWFVACAPKIVGILRESYLLHGICYLTEGTIEGDADATVVHRIKPLRLKAYQGFNSGSVKAYNYMFGEQGFSVHVTDDGREVLIGAPGVMGWRGTVIRYRQLSFRSNGYGLSNVFHQGDGTNGLTHETIVPNPLYTGIGQDSYFGYAVTSGRFLGTRKVLYVGSAPQASDQHGEVIIFDFADNPHIMEAVMHRYQTIVGQQLGEYFGYSLLVEDFNSDGLPDLAIGAPMHSLSREYDNGAVFVNLNRGELLFDLQAKLTGAYELGGRFGTSLGKIGDCNRDGYADIAVGAPFEGKGAVYIFHGSANGLRTKPSQRLEPPAASTPLTPSPQSMFGHAISRGVDIDGNGYNDLAVGAPNGETVYVYRAYPIVRVEARLNSTVRELPSDGGSFEIAVCWTMDLPVGLPFDVPLKLSVDVDAHMGRAAIAGLTTSDGPDEVILVGGVPVCKHFLVAVSASPTTLHKPITFDLQYDMAERASPSPDDDRFCEHCALLDPNEANRVHERIPFRTGCRTETCASDLRTTSIRWIDIASPYVIGGTKTANLELEIENSGENAYLPQANVTVPESLRLAKLQPECQVSAAVAGHVGVLCDLNNRLPVQSGSRIKYTLAFDMTKLEGSRRTLKVRVKSLTSSKEQWPTDNEMEHTLLLREFSQIEILSKTTPQAVSLEQQKGTINVTHLVKLHNNGPSTLRDFLLYLDVPLTYSTSSAAKRCRVIKLQDIQVTSSYNDTALEIDWLLPDDGSHFLKQTFSFYSETQTEDIPPSGSVNIPNNFAFSPQRRVEGEGYGQFHAKRPFDDLSELDVARQKRSSLWVPPTRQSSGSTLLQDLPPNRTLFFNCARNDPGIGCLQLQARLAAFPPGHKPILVELRYKLDLDAVEACLREPQDIFVLQILSDLEKPSDGQKKTFAVARNNPHMVVYRNASRSTPIWIYVTASMGGLILLAAISYTMHRRGFFERHLRQELEKLHRESTSFIDPDGACDSKEEDGAM